MVDKKVFISSLNSIKKQIDIDKKCNDAFKIILPESCISGYNTDDLIRSYINLLKVCCNDTEKWIEYFIFDLHFGESKDLTEILIDKNTKIKIDTPEKLYDFMKKRYSKNKQKRPL